MVAHAARAGNGAGKGVGNDIVPDQLRSGTCLHDAWLS
jgi:hypothetical protein